MFSGMNIARACTGVVKHAFFPKIIFPTSSSPTLASVQVLLLHTSDVDCGKYTGRRSKKRTKRFLQRAKPEILDLAFAGDMAEQPSVDLSLPRVDYQQSEQVKVAEEAVQKIFSLEFADGKEVLKHRMEEMRLKMQKNPTDIFSAEIRIALMTVQIRNLIPHVTQFRKDKCAKSKLYLKIARRKKWLKLLRMLDYSRFVWLCNELKIKWIPYPVYKVDPSRSATRRREAVLAAHQIKFAKLDALKKELSKEKDDFMIYKETSLTEIERQLADLKIEQEKIGFDFDVAMKEQPPHFKPKVHRMR
ncbi:unnamed protein product [Owenia fusiformis]|uniref:Small ribosomal subunit protein uS15m n=1 Tax=Owenia fusiformis TaxID=6347 RepID=A0A8J1TD87_OWEFU|nr:unnamed protein product [Owenia fusiformis]